MEKAAFIKALMEKRNIHGALEVAHHGPILPLHSIEFKNLPVHEKVKDLMRAIMQSASPYDKSPVRNVVGNETFGAMRQIHLNEPNYLPKLNVDVLSHRAKIYDVYAATNKHNSNDRGGGNVTSGYIEYTAGTNDLYGWGGNRFRIVFDYVNSKLYFAPLHYASWSIAGNEITDIDKPARGSGAPNPFFWIVNIK